MCILFSSGQRPPASRAQVPAVARFRHAKGISCRVRDARSVALVHRSQSLPSLPHGASQTAIFPRSLYASVRTYSRADERALDVREECPGWTYNRKAMLEQLSTRLFRFENLIWCESLSSDVSVASRSQATLSNKYYRKCLSLEMFVNCIRPILNEHCQQGSARVFEEVVVHAMRCAFSTLLFY